MERGGVIRVCGQLYLTMSHGVAEPQFIRLGMDGSQQWTKILYEGGDSRMARAVAAGADYPSLAGWKTADEMGTDLWAAVAIP